MNLICFLYSLLTSSREMMPCRIGMTQWKRTKELRKAIWIFIWILVCMSEVVYLPNSGRLLSPEVLETNYKKFLAKPGKSSSPV